MTVLTVDKLTKYYGETPVLRDISFMLQDGERVGLVGPNGAGKSTLLKCLTGEIQADGGQVMARKGARLGYLAQGAEFTPGLTVWQAMLEEFFDLIGMQQEISYLEGEMARPEVCGDPRSLRLIMQKYSALSTRFEHAGGYQYQARIRAILGGLGFGEEDLSRPVESFSGGQKTRIALGRILLRQPEVLLLDEPTNFLDMEAVEWLEGFLTQYPGAVLLVSHDRYFLDKLAHRILDLEDTKLIHYKGNYSNFLLQKTQAQASQARAYAQQQTTIRRLEEFIRRNKAGQNTKQARSRENRLQRMERLTRPAETRWLSMDLTPLHPSADKVITVTGLTKAYGEKILFRDVHMEILRGERVALLGPNGCGKTTLLRALMEEIAADAGEIRIGARVRIGYYAQEQENLQNHCTILEELMAGTTLTPGTARNILGQFLFRGNEVFKLVGQLSGGERSRLALAKLCLTGANFLILDEPTNHLDIQAREVLEDVLDEYPGTILLVSHDRYLLNRLCDRVLVLENGILSEFRGNYDDYRMHKVQTAACTQPTQAVKEKQLRPRQTRSRALQQVKSLEQEIEQVEREIKEVENRMADTATYIQAGEAQRLSQQYAELSNRLADLMEKWEQAAEALEE